MAIVIQQLSRNNHVINSHLQQSNDVTVGRDYTCEQRLDDVYVDAQHIKVTYDEQGQISVNDLNSVNGMKLNGKRTQNANIGHNDVITIGRTRLRIFSANQPVIAAKQLNPLEDKLEWLSMKRVFTTLLIAFIGITVIDAYLTTYTEMEVGFLIQELTSVLVVLCVIPFSFGLLSVLNKKEARIISQFNVVLIGLLILECISVLLELAIFNFNSPNLVGLISKGITWLVYLIGFWFVMYLAFHQTQLKRNSIVLSISAILVVTTYLPDQFDERDFIFPARVSTSITSPTFLIESPVTTNTFINNTESLFEVIASELNNEVVEIKTQ